MGYGLIFVVGLLTSLHCLAMCGGITLSQTLPDARPGERLAPALLYNAGRVALLHPARRGGGGRRLGLQPVGHAEGAAAGRGRALHAVHRGADAGRLPLALPAAPSRRPPARAGGRGKLAAASRRGPFFVGLLNGLMPCGPLQTMQVYALGTGSFLAGAFSMLLFSLGTVPLLFGFGALSSLLGARFNRGMLRASGVLVIALGLVMFTRGMSLFGVALPALPGGGGAGRRGPPRRRGADGDHDRGVGALRPLRRPGGRAGALDHHAPARRTSTAATTRSPSRPTASPGSWCPAENLIEFTPGREGTITYTCWMGMISSTIRAVPDLARLTARDLRDPGREAGPAPPASARPSETAPAAGRAGPRAAAAAPPPPAASPAGGCRPTRWRWPAGTGRGRWWRCAWTGTATPPPWWCCSGGCRPTIRFLPAEGALSACNYLVEFPGYNGRLDLSRGQLETPPLEVRGDFTFRCGMGMLNGYVKAVDDLAAVDLGAVRREVGAFRASVAGNGCCGSSAAAPPSAARRGARGGLSRGRRRRRPLTDRRPAEMMSRDVGYRAQGAGRGRRAEDHRGGRLLSCEEGLHRAAAPAAASAPSSCSRRPTPAWSSST